MAEEGKSEQETGLTNQEDHELAMLQSYEELSKKDQPEEKTEEPQVEAKAEATPEAQPEEVEELPQSWKKEKAQVWKSMPKEARDYWRERESELYSLADKQAKEYARGKQTVAGMYRAAEPFIDTWAAEGKTLEQGVTQALALQKHLQTAKGKELVLEIMQAKGVTLDDLTKKDEGEANRPYANELQSLKATVEGLLGQQRAAVEAHYTKQATDTLQHFTNAKNADGSLVYPGMQDAAVRSKVKSLVEHVERAVPELQGDFAGILKTAYQWAGGQIHNGVGAQQQPQTLARSSTQNTQKLKRAITSGYGKSSGSSESKAKFENKNDAWAATFEEFGIEG